MENTKRIIWTNAIDIEDWREDIKEWYDDEELTDNEIWDLALRENAENLEDEKENLNKPQTIERFKRSQKLYPRTKNGKKKKIVYQFDLEGNFIKQWEGVKTTEEEGFSSACVSLCCSGKYKQHKGYIWSYSNRLNN